MLFRSHKVNIKDLNDLDIIARYQKHGHKDLIAVLFQRYSHIILGVCMKYLKNLEDAEDHTMQLFEILVDKLKTHEIQHFKSWLHMVVKNHCLMTLRKRQSQRPREEAYQKSLQDDMELQEETHPKERELELMQDIDQLNQAINQLKDEQKICIELFYLQQKSYQEVSDQTGYDLKQVKSYIQNGKRNLKIYITQNAQRQ